MASIASKVFAVTGGASGMGLSTCKMLAERKAKAICIGDFNEQNFRAVQEELNKINPDTEIHMTKVDVSKSSSVQSWISGIISKFGQLDGAVNAAGLPQAVGDRKRDGSAISNESDETWSSILGVNLTGVFYSCREQIKAMRELPQSPRSIVNISSLASFIHGPDCFSYGVSKIGVAYLTQCIANEVLPIKIRVNCVSPGKIHLSEFNIVSMS